MQRNKKGVTDLASLKEASRLKECVDGFTLLVSTSTYGCTSYLAQATQFKNIGGIWLI